MLYFILAVIFLLLLNYFRKYKYYQDFNKIPAVPGLPIIGNTHQFRGGNDAAFEITYGMCDFRYPMRRLRIVNNDIVLVYSAQAMEALLSHKTNIEKGFLYAFLNAWLGTGLLTSKGEKWFHRRKMLTPAFHFKILEDFLPVFNSKSEILVEKLKKSDGKRIDIRLMISLCTLDIICETAMGKPINAQVEEHNEYVNALLDIGIIISIRTRSVIKQSDFLFNFTEDGNKQKKALEVLHGFTKKVIRDRKSERALTKANGDGEIATVDKDDIYAGKKKRVMAFLDLLLDVAEKEENVLDDEALREEVDTFMFEGHDTTSVGISWALFLLGHNPEHQAKLHEELDEIFGDSDRPVELEDLTKMKYLELCIKESQRIYPSVPFFGRYITEPFKVGDYTIPAGCNCNMFTYKLHRDPDVFPDPEKFDPDRFLPENTRGRSPYAYVPFSAGSRNCIGQKFAVMEEKTVLSHVLRNFTVKSFTPRDKLVHPADLVLRSRDELVLSFTPRR